MKQIINFLFSVVDSTALLLLILSVFRFEIKKIYVKLIFSSVIFSLVSMIVISVGLHNYSIPIQLLLTIILFRFIFKENIIYSIFSSIFGYITYIGFQGLLAYLLMSYKIIDANDMQPYSIKGYMAQAISLIIVIIISIYMRKMNEGFSFDFDNPFNKKRKVSSKPYLIVAIVAALITAISYPFLYKSDIASNFLVTILVTIFCFSVLIFLSFKRNKEELISLSN